ncbi:MAG: TIM barrel protein [Fulvimarina manganoxydans]|uniref:hydroxypyruvate isomerase family protein n=1 Tax=Fulvimarina manganoxydans TaxID=937218 RepID=UPI0023551A16|nr:TIM barrel protein [Fulvimarina manganoxydans]MCK5934696.1 TIM barrel protein [Fulvimarina manganoxydans]
MSGPTRLRLSANLGFLYADLPLAEAIQRAARAGFDAVECHWPYDEPIADVRAALGETGLAMVSMNARKGPNRDDFGLAALPGREAEARTGIEEAIAYGAAIGAKRVHVLAGRIEANDVSRACFVETLRFAAQRASRRDMAILIEPMNRRDAPGYFLSTIEQAAEIVTQVGEPNCRILFDCYHVQINQGDLLRRFEAHRDLIGHVQFAGVPERGAPDLGELAYERLLPAIRDLGYEGAFGAEYRPGGPTEDSLSWMKAFGRS